MSSKQQRTDYFNMTKNSNWIAAGVLASAIAASAAVLVGCGGSDGNAHAGVLPVVPEGPSGSAFWDVYRQPDAQAKVGSIYWAQERSDAPAGSRAWNIVYVSEIVNGVKKYVSGEIYVPTAAAQGPRDVVLWNHETTGVADICAPSRRSLVVDGVSRVPGIKDLLAKGYVVAMSDYPGQGLPGPAWYMSGQPNARASLDVLRAVQNFPEAKASQRFVMYGWSQGGQTTMWTDAIAASYAPEFTGLGAGLIAPAVRIRELTLNSMTRTELAGYVISTLPGIKAAHPELKYGDFLTTEGLEQFPAMADGCFDIWETASTVTKPYQPQALTPGSSWWNAMTSVDNFTPRGKTPFVIYQGTEDVPVPASLTAKERQGLCAAGSKVDYKEFAGLDHETVVPEAAKQFPSWAQERFVGQAAASNCPAS
ncbi:alpha/beta fold hydrolase [Comamonas testosteroni]|uniref:alpha/beta fold hydrolase n=1 Tax=Comamonas testosteroni TaxID=285 RepID=UPI0006A58FD2|nr:alpha/beta fold hydrolase [Comamonas testosteroni]